jgi:hypothetical protein
MVIASPFVTDFDVVIAKNSPNTWGKYVNRVKIGGAKITLDGSPRARPPTSPRLT